MHRISYRFLVPGWSAKPLVSAHDRIMGSHRWLFESGNEVRCYQKQTTSPRLLIAQVTLHPALTAV